MSGRRHYLTEQVKAGPKAAKEAESVRSRLLNQVAEKRNPRTSATVDQLLDRYLDQFDGAPNTLSLYRGYVRNHISPYLGRLTVGALDADVLDSFYAELRRCRTHCSGRRPEHHRVTGPHKCDRRCGGAHTCQPLSPTTVRHMHFILSGAYKRAVRWRWVSVSPLDQSTPPGAPKPNPQPPTPAEAARIVNEAWRDPDWGALIWVAMTTGARRGELCAIRWSSVDLDEGRETIWLRRAIRRADQRYVEANLKTHQQRRLALDSETVLVLRAHRDRCFARARTLGLESAPDAFVFSTADDPLAAPQPDSVTQRYDRLADRLGIITTFHKLRHYSATELIAAGVDVRTVAGRLGHAGGGTTTLRAYTAWVSEADQRAASGLPARMPQRPTEMSPQSRARFNPRAPYELVAADIARRVETGTLPPGSSAPTADELVTLHDVSVSTARRAVALAKEWGVLMSDGHGRPRVAAVVPDPMGPPPVAEDGERGETLATERLAYWSVTLIAAGGVRCAPRLVPASLADPDSFRIHALGIARVEMPDRPVAAEEWSLAEFELEVRRPDVSEVAAILRWD